jgi:outer membrane protein assembly factor BamB
MKKLIICVITLMMVCLATTVYAKRISPKPVTPVIKDGIEYSAPLDLMEYVVAKSIKTNREIWRKQIYEVKFNPRIEGDIQSIYITHLAIEGENLLVVNEKWQRFKLDLKTHKISKWGEVERLYPIAANEQNIYASSTNGKLYAINSDGQTNWTFELSDRSTSPPSIADDGTIYVSSSMHLYAFRPDGVLKWKFRLPQNSKSFFPVVGIDDTIYLGIESGKIYALSPEGKIKWKFNTHGKMQHPPTVSSEGTIYVTSVQGLEEGRVYAINKDGSKKWMVKTRDGLGRTPVIGIDDTIYVLETHSSACAISPKGVVKMQIYFGGGPVFVAGPEKNVFAAYDYRGTLSKIKPDGTIELLFKIDDSRCRFSLSVGVDKTIYLTNGEQPGTLYSIFPSGHLKWKYNLNSTDLGPLPLTIDDKGSVYIGYRGKFYGTVCAINPDGTKKWEFITGE